MKLGYLLLCLTISTYASLHHKRNLAEFFSPEFQIPKYQEYPNMYNYEDEEDFNSGYDYTDDYKIDFSKYLLPIFISYAVDISGISYKPQLQLASFKPL